MNSSTIAVPAPIPEMEAAAIPFDAEAQFDAVVTEVNTTWLLLCATLVFFMQAGFAMLEAGAVAPKNAKHILFKNMLDGAIGVVSWLVIGYPLAFGEARPNGVLGVGQYFLSKDDSVDYSFWFFQSTFVITAATITSGALAERCRTMAYVIYSTFLSAIVYPVVVHWMWSPYGWLSSFTVDGYAPVTPQGIVDFAGGGVVHAVGGVSALVGAWLLGYRNQFSTDPSRYRPRFERLVDENRWVTNAAPPNSVSLQAMGVFILWFGWFGFNCGSTIAIHGYSGVAGLIAVNTVVAGAAASLAAAIIGRFVNADKRFSMSDSLNGALAGLVASTSGCSTVEPWGAFIIGIVGAGMYKFTSELMLKLRIDDPLDAVAVHMMPGLWSLIGVGLFASRRHMTAAYSADHSAGLFMPEGGGMTLGVNILGGFVICAWTGSMAFLAFFTLKKLDVLRITPEQEEAGLGVDIAAEGGFDTSFASTQYTRGDELTDNSSHQHIGSMSLSRSLQSRSEMSGEKSLGGEVLFSDEAVQVLDLLASGDNADVLRRMLEAGRKDSLNGRSKPKKKKPRRRVDRDTED